MNVVDLKAELKNNAYPGRGIIFGKTPDGQKAVIAYFIMGRSENSRNRVFVPEGDGLRTQALDPDKMTDPSLVIYSPVRCIEDVTIVTNGDQTDTIYEFLSQGLTFEDALHTRKFEPDGPNYTPRISGVISNTGVYELSILKSATGNPAYCQRFFYEYEKPIPGQGHFIHTYERDGDPLPSFCGEPKLIETDNSIDNFTEMLWENLNPDNKVALFTRYIDLATGQHDTRITDKSNFSAISSLETKTFRKGGE